MNFKKITLILCAFIFLSAERNANAQSATFNYTGSSQTWTVPCGVTSVTIVALGAQGGGASGGLGTSATGQLNVVSGQVLTVNVGGQANVYNGAGTGGTGGPTVTNGNGASYYGGAGGNGFTGGGMSDVKLGALELISAGGGGGEGGGGGGGCGTTPGVGGAPNGSNSATGMVSGTGGNGGNGGTGNYGSGGNGLAGGGGLSCNASPWGSGGVASTGGASGGAACYCSTNPTAGGTTATSTGGAGGIGGNMGCGGYQSPGSGGGGGGGGGGYPASGLGGGGGGGGTQPSNWNGSPGGGGGASGQAGPSYTAGMTSLTSTTLNIQSGNGSVVITWAVPAAPTVTAHAVSNVPCNGGNSGSASETVTGGSSPFTYLWTPSAQTNATATGLVANTYTVKVTDACGNSASASVAITQPNILTVSASTTTNVLCNGGNTGSASSTESGGTTPYTYSWTGGGTNSTVSGLTAGTYTLTVTDKNGCTGTASAAITQPTVLTVAIDSTTNVLCNGGNTGSATSAVSGGTSPYTYLWTGGGTNYKVSGLSAGTYTLTVADANGCTGTATATITQPTAIGLTSTSTPDNGSGNGTATVTASGGTGPYNYLWTPSGKTTAAISGESKGSYCCKVTDANGCKDSTCVTIKSTAGVDGITSNSGEIVVYPNPNNGQFTIKSSVGGASTVEIYNVLGEKVFTKSLSTTEGTNTIDISNQSTGVYLYRVISVTGDLLGEGKIILQK